MERDLDVAAIAAAMPCRRAVRAPELRRDARAETQLGQLLLNGVIAEQQYDAGVQLRDVVRRWHAATGAPRHDRGAMPLDGLVVGGGREMSLTQTQRAVEQYVAAWRALRDCGGVRAAQRVIGLCAYDESAIASAMEVYRKALKALAEFWHYR